MKTYSVVFILVIIGAGLSPPDAYAGNTPADNWAPVAEDTLDEMRAGFVLDNGLIVDIQLSKQIFVNGAPQAHTTFDSMDTRLAAFAGNDVNTLLQNTLNNQVLSTLTEIDISVSNLAPVQQHLSQTVMFETLFNNGLGQ